MIVIEGRIVFIDLITVAVHYGGVGVRSQNGQGLLQEGGFPQVVLIQESEVFPSRQAGPVVTGGGLSAVLCAADVPRLLKPQGQPTSVVRGGVVDHDEVHVVERLSQDASHGLLQIAGDTIESGDDRAHGRHRTILLLPTVGSNLNRNDKPPTNWGRAGRMAATL